MNMITLNTCPVCNSSNIAQHPWVGFGPDVTCEVMPGVNVNAAIVNRSSVCRECHLIFQNPRLSDSDLDTFYSKGYYRKMMTKASKGEEGFEMRRAKIDTEIIKLYVKTVESHLDVGCGRGFLLDSIEAKVKVGVEPDKGFVVKKNSKLYTDISQIKHKPFSLITAVHVLEHAAKPLDVLKNISRLLGTDGIAVIEVPFGEDYGKSLEFVHLYHFEPNVLKNMCVKSGLHVLHIHFTPHLLLVCKKKI